MMSRRNFLRISAFGIGVAAIGSGVAVLRGRSAPGDLDEGTVAVLMAAAEIITGVAPLRGHYERYFRHHAAVMPGYRTIYLSFTERLSDRGFEAADGPGRARILEAVRTSADFDVTMDNAIVQETLCVFARTDVWLQLGYVSWPGSARGLQVYKEPPT